VLDYTKQNQTVPDSSLNNAGPVKRETGERPVRTRHCKWKCRLYRSKVRPLETGRRQSDEIHEPGDLPAVYYRRGCPGRSSGWSPGAVRKRQVLDPSSHGKIIKIAGKSDIQPWLHAFLQSDYLRGRRWSGCFFRLGSRQ